VKILVTGFGPFDRFLSNPSREVARALSEENEDVIATTLPVVFGEGRKLLLEVLEKEVPDIVISFGLNGNISYIALEEIALNISSSEVKDNTGKILTDSVISQGSDLALRSTLPLRNIMDTLRENGIPAKLSYTAGTYLCNEVFYTLMEWCNENGKKGGFIHLPMATQMIAEDPRSYSIPHMSMEMILNAGRIILKSIR
jgi:pyroglutamyl-peptidase